MLWHSYEWITTTEGQKLIESTGYVPLSNNQKESEQSSKIEDGSHKDKVIENQEHENVEDVDSDVIDKGDVFFKLGNWKEDKNDDEWCIGEILVSLDGIKWFSAKQKTYTPYGFGSSIHDVPDFNNKKIIGIYTYDCFDNYTYYSYKINNGEVELSNETGITYKIPGVADY